MAQTWVYETKRKIRQKTQKKNHQKQQTVSAPDAAADQFLDYLDVTGAADGAFDVCGPPDIPGRNECIASKTIN